MNNKGFAVRITYCSRCLYCERLWHAKYNRSLRSKFPNEPMFARLLLLCL